MHYVNTVQDIDTELDGECSANKVVALQLNRFFLLSRSVYVLQVHGS